VILVDTSVWVDHLRKGSPILQSLLLGDQVLIHPFVIGELACGTLKRRRELLTLLGSLPRLVVANHDEVIEFIERRLLFGSGLGWVDMHLLVSAMLGGASLWTLDRKLVRVASGLAVAWYPSATG
jgi:predicted nucleic acid-binding protein